MCSKYPDMRILFVVKLMVCVICASAQIGSEIYLFDVKMTPNGIAVSNPVNITNHPGYDNQPSFHTSSPLLYYSSFNDDGRSDIKVYNYQTGKTNQLTTTQEREYSPTLTPDGKFISCIIQRDNGAQDLGKYPAAGGEAFALIDNLIVGYHAWVDADNLILFVLGEPQTLQWYDLAKNQNSILSENIGRALHKIPGSDAMSFVQKKSENEWIINKLDIATKNISAITATLPGREDLTWTKDGRIIMSDGEKLFFYNPKNNRGWTEITTSGGSSVISGITRLAISRDGKKLAVVASEQDQ